MLSFFLQCIHSFFFLMLTALSFSRPPFTFHPDLHRPLRTDSPALTSSPHTIDSLYLNTFLNVESLVDMGSAVRWCAMVCVSNGSVTGRQWAGAAGFQLMTTLAIYLLLNISRIRRDGWFSFFSLLYVEASDLYVYCIVKAMECTVHTNRVLYSSLVVYRMIVIFLFYFVCFKGVI